MKIILPELGEGINNVEVTEILIQNNSQIKKDDVLMVVESEKASMEIPSELSGTIKQVLINKGDTINPGDEIFEIISDSNNEIKDNEKDNSIDTDIKSEDLNQINKTSSLTEDSEKDEDTEQKPASNQNIERETTLSNNIKLATPSIRKLARELGCDLNAILGTGKNNRVTREDILDHVKEKVVPQNNNSDMNKKYPSKPKDSIDEKSFLDYGAITKKSFNKVREITSKRMTDSWTTIPHVTHFDEIETDHLIKLKKDLESIKEGIKVSFLSFILKALSKALKDNRTFNSSPDVDNNVLIIKEYINIGVAADTPKGLVVPVIHNIDKLSLKKINDEVFRLSKKAKEGNLTIKEMSGGTFTVSSLGGIGGRFFTPIINKPEVAIIGISKMYKKLTLDKYGLTKEVTVLPFSLSYDHRIIDGADAARFCNSFKKLLSNLSTFD